MLYEENFIKGKKVLLVDADPQADLRAYAGGMTKIV